jgi:hypothetical protein
MTRETVGPSNVMHELVDMCLNVLSMLKMFQREWRWEDFHFEVKLLLIQAKQNITQYILFYNKLVQ